MAIKSLCPDGVTPLWNKSQMECSLVQERLPAWVDASYSAFVNIVRQPAFPCFFATNAENKGLIRYAIASSVTDPEPEVTEHILKAVHAYLAEANIKEKGQDEDVYLLTLVVFFPPEPEPLTVEEYARGANEWLNALLALDREACPADLRADPQYPDWDHAFRGRALFFNVATPANQQRRSRNLGPGMTFVINPVNFLERLGMNGGRRSVYHRVEHYDPIPLYPLLSASYSVGHKDFGLTLNVLPDDNDSKIPWKFNNE